MSLAGTTEVVKHGMGGDRRSSRPWPDRTDFGAIMLERGVAHGIEFDE